MKKEEILNLHNLTEEEQTKALYENEDVESSEGLQWIRAFYEGREYFRHETLAEYAFRLRDEVEYRQIKELYKIVFPADLPDPWPLEETVKDWWGFQAKPINWIQAALLAKEG